MTFLTVVGLKLMQVFDDSGSGNIAKGSNIKYFLQYFRNALSQTQEQK